MKINTAIYIRCFRKVNFSCNKLGYATPLNEVFFQINVRPIIYKQTTFCPPPPPPFQSLFQATAGSFSIRIVVITMLHHIGLPHQIRQLQKKCMNFELLNFVYCFVMYLHYMSGQPVLSHSKATLNGGRNIYVQK